MVKLSFSFNLLNSLMLSSSVCLLLFSPNDLCYHNLWVKFLVCAAHIRIPGVQEPYVAGAASSSRTSVWNSCFPGESE